MKTSGQPLSLDPQLYDAYVDWPRRLANEEPFYRRLFEEVGVRKLLDAACGSGRHAAMFHSWGLAVDGADVSPQMIALCRANHGEAERLRWSVRSFSDPPPEPGQYDAVICTGNSLTLADESAPVARAVKAMLGGLRPGGVCVMQVRNIYSMPEGPVNWSRTVRFISDGVERLLTKGMHRVGGLGHVSFIEHRLDGQEPPVRIYSTSFTGLRVADLLAPLEAAGASDVRIYGDYQLTPYDEKTSTDLMLVCRR